MKDVIEMLECWLEEEERFVKSDHPLKDHFKKLPLVLKAWMNNRVKSKKRIPQIRKAIEILNTNINE